MRARRVGPRSRPSIDSSVFTKLVNASKVGGADGYDILGLALARRVLAEPVRFLRDEDVSRLAILVEGADVRSIVRLFVRRIRWALRRVPFRRRYRSFADGVRRAVIERQAALPPTSVWSQESRIVTP